MSAQPVLAMGPVCSRCGTALHGGEGCTAGCGSGQGCAEARCPRCGHVEIDVEQSVLARTLARWLGLTPRRGGEGR